MDKPPPAFPAGAQKSRLRTRDERLAREAAALRANLLKRKQQARERQSQDCDNQGRPDLQDTTAR